MTICILLTVVSSSSADIYGSLDDEGYLRFDSSKNTKYDRLITEMSKNFGVEPNLIKAVIKAESDFNDMAVSRKGAQGLMQLMPYTANAMEIDDPFSPEENIKAGTQYLSQLLNQYKNNKSLALAAYNAGPEVVKAYKGVPPFPETRTFIRRVLQYYKEFSAGD